MQFITKTTEQFDAQVKNVAKQSHGLLQTKYGLWFVGLVSFVESALPVPLVTDPFLILYILANRTRAVAGVVVTTIMSVLGGVTAFVTAAFFQPFLLAQFSDEVLAEFQSIVARFQEEMFVVTILGAVTPVPYTLVGYAAGFVEGSLLIFVVASVIGRGARYALVGYMTYRFGMKAMERLRGHITTLTVVTLFVIVLYFLFK